AFVLNNLPLPRADTKKPAVAGFLLHHDNRSADFRVQFATGVTLVHAFQRDRFDLGSIAGGTEGFVTGDTDITHGFDGFGEEFTRVELARVFGHHATHGTGRGQAQVGVDVHLAHAVLDAFNDFFHRYTVGFFNVAAVLVDDRQPFLRYRRRTVHHQVGIRNALVNFFDTVDGQNVACWRLGELVGTVAGTDGNGQRVHTGFLHEIRSFFRVGQHLAVIQHAFSADAVFFTGHTGFQRTQTTQLTFYRHATGVRHLDGATGYVHVVLIGSRGFTVFTQRTVHHHRAETQLDRTLTDVRRRTVILVHTHRKDRKSVV